MAVATRRVPSVPATGGRCDLESSGCFRPPTGLPMSIAAEGTALSTADASSHFPPLTEIMSLRWRPTVAYYARRFTLLEELEQDDLVRAFRVGEHEVGIQISGPQEELVMAYDRLSVRALGVTDDRRTELAELVARAVAHIGVDQLADVRWLFQYLLPIEGGYDAARRRGIGRLAPGLAPLLLPDDFAVLLDLHSILRGFQGQVEFGIVERDEVETRVARMAGRISDEFGAPPWQIDSEPLPDVATFADLSLHSMNPTHSDMTAGGLSELWLRALQEASVVPEALHQAVGQGPESEDPTGGQSS